MTRKMEHCPRCGGKGVVTVRNGKRIWTCPTSGGKTRGHGVFRQDDVSAEEQKPDAPAREAAIGASQPVAGVRQISVEEERANAGLAPGTESMGNDDVGQIAARSQAPSPHRRKKLRWKG